MSKLTTFLVAFILLFVTVGCNQNQKAPTRIVSQQVVKTDILGLTLCDKTNEKKVEKALQNAIGEYIITDSQKDQTGKLIWAIPSSLSFSYAGCAWTYVDVTLDGDDSITAIGLTASYENIENAKRQYEQIVSTFEQKYGRGNVHPEGQLTFWTDDVNSVGVYYQESASIDGSDRSFCSLYYTNIALSDKLDAQNMSDI